MKIIDDDLFIFEDSNAVYLRRLKLKTRLKKRVQWHIETMSRILGECKDEYRNHVEEVLDKFLVELGWIEFWDMKTSFAQMINETHWKLIPAVIRKELNDELKGLERDL